MKLHLPNALRSALLSCLAAIAPIITPTFATGTVLSGVFLFCLSSQSAISGDVTFSTVTESLNNVTYSGYIITLDVSKSYVSWGSSNIQFASGNTTFQFTDESTMLATGTNGKVSGQTGWHYFVGKNNQLSAAIQSGHTLHLTGATKDTVIGIDYAPINLGGLIVDSGNFTYTLMGATSGNQVNRNMVFDAANDVNLSIASNTEISLGTGTLSINKGGAWNVAAGKVLTLKASTINVASGQSININNATETADDNSADKTASVVDMQTAALSIAEGAQLTIGEGTTLKLGANTASSAGTGKLNNQGELYMNGHSGSFVLDNSGTVSLSAQNSIASLTNTGTLKFSEGSSLSVSAILNSIYEGKSYNVGTLQVNDVDQVDNWASYFGVNDGSVFSYSNGQLTVTTDGSAYIWNGTADSYSWSENNVIKGGSSTTLTDGVRLYLNSTAGYKTVKMDSVISLAGVILQDDGYTFDVTVDNSLPSSFVVTASTYTLSKTGAATLGMTTAQLAQLSGFTLAEGTLKLTDTLAQVDYSVDSSVNLENISAVEGAILSIAAAGSEDTPGKDSGTNVSHIQLSDTFKGILEVRTGKLHIAADGKTGSTQLGGTTKLLLNGGGIIITSNGGSFGAQTLSKDIEVGASGGYIDLFGSSNGVKKDAWSAKHTGSLTGQGVLTFVGYGEWILAGDYDSFTGGIKMGAEFQRLYISSDMPELQSILHDTTLNDADIVVGYEKSVTVSVANEESIKKSNVIHISNASTFEHNGGISIAANKTFAVQAYNTGDTGTYKVKHINFETGAKLSVGTGIEANITGTEQYTVSAGEIAIAANAKVTDYRQLTIDGDVSVSGDGAYVQSGSLTINAGKILTLSGIVSIEKLTNNGTLTFDNLSSLSLLELANADSYHIGAVTGGDSIKWNELLGINNRLVSYDSETGYLRLEQFAGLVWADDSDEENAWNEKTNWQIAGSDVNLIPVADSDVILSADTNYSNTITISNDVEVGSLTVSREHSIHVASDTNVSLGATNVILENSANLNKTGAGTLNMSVATANATQMHIAEGTLNINETLANTVNSTTILENATNLGTWRESGLVVDLSAITAASDGILQVTAAGSYSDGNDSSRLTLGAAFTGKVKVIGGQIGHSSDMGNASQIILSEAGLVFNNDGDDSNDGNTIFSTPVYIEGNGALRAWGAYSNTPAIISVVSGAASSTLHKYDSGNVQINELSDFTGNLNIHAGKLIINDGTGEVNVANIEMQQGAHLQVTNNGTLTATTTFIAGDNVQVSASIGSALNLGTLSFTNNGELTVSGGGNLNINEVKPAGGYLYADNQATLNISTTNVTGNAYVGAFEQSTINLGDVSIGSNTTLNITGGGIHNLKTLNLENGGKLVIADNTAATVTTATAAKTITDGYPGSRTGVREINNKDFTITVGNNSTLTDNGTWELYNGSDLTVDGGGLYNVAGISFSSYGNNAGNSLTIGENTTLHITGTNTTGSKFGDAFSLGHWNTNNTVTIRGALILESGLSTACNGANYANQGTINVENGGLLAFNNGLYANSGYTNNENHITINVKGGATLEVSGTTTQGSDRVTINIEQNGIVFGGNANSATKSTITNNLNFNAGVYIGAKEGTQLSLTAANSMSWLVILGDGSEEGGDTLGSTLGAGGEVRFVESITTGNLYVRKGGAATFENGLTANNSASTNNGALSVAGPLNLVGFTNKGSATLSGELNFSNFVTNEAGADLTLSGATLSLSQAIANSGKITIENPEDTIIKLENLQETNVTGAVQTWSIINNAGDGSLEGWNTLTLSNFLLNGESLTLGDWDAYSIENGRVSLYMLYRYWDSVAGTDAATWDTDTTAVWRDNTADEGLTYESGSRVAFGDYEDVDDINGGSGTTLLNKTVSVSGAGVTARVLDIFGTDYVFQGGDVAVTDNMSIQQSARFDSSLLIGSSTTPLTIDVWEGHTLTVADLKTLYTATYGTPVYEDGSFIKTGSGTMVVTNGIHGNITSATVNGGKLELGEGVTLAVGANRLTGGSIENAAFLTTGEITRAQSQNTVTAHNIIKAADGTTNAVLTDATLHVGSKDAYATLQDITFAGNSALTGYITFEHTQSANDMAVATGGTLAVNGVSFDLHGLSGGDKVLIANADSSNSAETTRGTITGWDTAKFLYSGIAINAAAINTSKNGMVTIITDGQNPEANLYWDGAPNGLWDTTTTNWSLTAGADGNEVFTALSNVYFSELPEAGVQEISISRDMVVATLNITQGDYRFSDARISALGNTNIKFDDGEVIFSNNRLDTQGVLSTSGTGTTTFDTTVTAGSMDLRGYHTIINGATTVAGTLNINAGSDIAYGSVTIDGSITAQDINIAVQAGLPEEATYADARVTAEGTITATGTMTLGGTATQQYLNTVTANTININNTTHGIYFSDVRAEQMNIVEGARAHILKKGETIAESSVNKVNLAGTLLLDAYAATYNKELNITTCSDSAALFFGTGCTINNVYISGAAGDAYDNGYSDLDIESNARYVTIKKIEQLGDLSISKGNITVQNAVDAVHNTLKITDNGGLNLLSDNIMAEGSGSISISGSTLALNGTAQTLRSGNALHLSTATISGEASGTGLNFIEGGELHYSGRNTISANMTVAGDTELSIAANKQAEDMLTISGGLSGSGNINITGSGIVALSEANAYTGIITVSDISTLALQHTDALANATLKLEADAILHADRMLSVTPYNIGTLDLVASGPVMINGVQHDAGTIQINDLVATDSVSAADAAFKLGELKSESDLTLNILLGFEGDKSLENMKTYNLFTSEAGLDISTLNISLHVIGNNEANHVADNQYKVGYDEAAKTIYIRTMLGHIWDGGMSQGGDGDGIWSTTSQDDANWSGKYYDESIAYNDAIFADLDNTDSATVTIKGSVNPGDIYFETDNTDYVLTYAEDGKLADGNNIHKSGTSTVTLSLPGAIFGNVDVASGDLIIAKTAQVQGKATIAAQSHLKAEEALSFGNYSISGNFTNMVMDKQGLTGADSTTPGIADDTVLAGAATMLNNIRFTGEGSLANVIISEGVSVAEGAQYTLSGTVTFDDTLTNAGTVNFAKDMVAELGKLSHADTTDASGTTTYTYQLVTMSGAGSFGDEHYYLSKEKILINGVNLSSGLADNVATVHSFENGTLSICIGNITSGEGETLTVDGSVGIPYWDARWGAETAPVLTRLYTGTDATATVTFGEGNGTDANYYTYGNIVKDGGNALAVTLSAAATGSIAAGRATGTEDARETWIYDCSAIGTVVSGVYGSATGDAVAVQRGATHLYVDTEAASGKVLIVGGSYNANQEGDSYLTIKNGTITDAVGGSYNGTQTGTARVYVDGGTLTNLYAGGYNSSLTAVQTENGDKKAVEMLLTGGSLSNVFGGGYNGSIEGDIYVRADGDADITSMLVGGSQGGSVNGNIVMDLVGGSAVTVHAAGTGNASVTGDVTVNLYKDFNISSSLYGGKQNNSGVSNISGTSTLHFADAGDYILGKSHSYAATADSVTISGFDVLSLAEDAHVVVILNKFDIGCKSNAEDLVVSGPGTLEVLGNTMNFSRNVTLTDSATLKISTSGIGKSGDTSDDRTITVSNGATLDFSGFPIEAGGGPNSLYPGLGFNTIISGDGVDNKGAIYKGKFLGEYNQTEEQGGNNPGNKLCLPKITLTDNASAVVTEGEYLYMNQTGLNTSNLTLNGYTFTKRGEGQLIARTVAISAGTVLVHEGVFGADLVCNGKDADMVLAGNASLQLNSTNLAGTNSLEIRSLSGAGDVVLNGSLLTLHTTVGSEYYDRYMDEAQSYDQFMSTTGFVYSVYSGVITDGDEGIGILAKAGNGVHYLSGSDSTYSGGTHINEGRLYLLGSSTQHEFAQGGSSVEKGVVGTGALVWESSAAELYLGHGVHLYNDGTTNEVGALMTIGVDGAPQGMLSNFIGIHSLGENGETEYITMGGTEYVEIDTHNLRTISVNAVYADGSSYVAGTEIDRNKMLLIKASDWADAQNATVTGFTETGYNEATYSGVLKDTISGGVTYSAGLRKVGVGTLILDQANTYTGNTVIEGGTLVLQGWAQLGESSDSLYVDQQNGTSLKLSYDGSYGNEITEIANNIQISGTGDERWNGDSATDGKTAALISDIGSDVRFALSGNISGDGNVLHTGDGTLVMSGDSTYTGGTEATRGTIEIQSAQALGASETDGKVVIDEAASLHATVKAGFNESRMATTLAATGNDIKGDVVISGTSETERILHMASNGYDAQSTTVNENGTLLVNGEGVSATTARLSGSGAVAVSDASGSAARADIDSMMDYSGDFVVEGDNASINVATGVFNGGSMDISGQNASVKTNADIIVATNQHLALSSTGTARAESNTSAIVSTTGAVSVNNGAEFSVSFEATEYDYDLKNLQNNSSISANELTILRDAQAGEMSYAGIGNSALEYDGYFDKDLAVNGQAAGAVQADNGLEFTGGSTYKADKANTSLLGGTLLLNPDESSLINFTMITEGDYAAMSLKNPNLQVVLFTDVGSVFFGLDNVTAEADNAIYFTQANRYLTGCPYIDDETLLVYDAYTQTVYLHYTVPEPTTATLSLLALAALAARRRRKK